VAIWFDEAQPEWVKHNRFPGVQQLNHLWRMGWVERTLNFGSLHGNRPKFEIGEQLSLNPLNVLLVNRSENVDLGLDINGTEILEVAIGN
jgi:hypothetical protein